MAVAGIADDVPPPVAAVVEGPPRLVVAEGAGQLADRPVVVGVLHRVREAALVARHVVVLHVGRQIAVAGKAVENLPCGRRLHLHGRLEGLSVRRSRGCPSARPRRSAGSRVRRPSPGRSSGPQGPWPAIRWHRTSPVASAPSGPTTPGVTRFQKGLRFQKVFQKASHPEHRIVCRIGYAAYPAVGRDPLAIDVAPRIATAKRTVHVVVETLLFEVVVRVDPNAGEKIVPRRPLVGAHGLEVPAEGDRNLRG